MLARSTWLAALGAFEAAARLQNFARAGEELHLTASAVSHHVRKLEGLLGLTLFQRHARGVSLTHDGRLLADSAAVALGDLDDVLEGLRQSRDAQRVRVSMLPSFAGQWFTPRIGDFAARHPELRVTIDAEKQLARFEPGGADFAIRYGLGQWTGMKAEFLMDDAMFPAASPAMARRIASVADIVHEPMIADMSVQGWRDWFRHAGVRRVELRAMHQIADTHLAMQAAASGAGVVLARRRIAQPLLDRGELVALPGAAMTTKYAYYIVQPGGRRSTAAAELLTKWLREQVT